VECVSTLDKENIDNTNNRIKNTGAANDLFCFDFINDKTDDPEIKTELEDSKEIVYVEIVFVFVPSIRSYAFGNHCC
jgi:hypothetical protein